MNQILMFLELVEQEYPGPKRRHNFQDALDSTDMRIGQAFMNVLRGTEYYEKLSGSPVDPFYGRSAGDVLRAIEFLTTKQIWEK